MNISGFEWDGKNEQHISRHSVMPYEVEEVFVENTIFRSTREGKMIAQGVTLSGRYLFVVFAWRNKGIVRVTTSREMTIKEKKYYKNKRS